MSATYQYQAGGTTVTGVNRPLSAVVGAPAGVIEGSLSRDAAGRVRTAHWQRRGTIRGTEVYGSVTYQYDAAGRRRQATDLANVSWHYGYNNRGEVTGAEKRAASGTVLSGWGHGYSYDDIGNRRQVVTPEGETLAMTANALNQISTRQTEQKAWLRGRAHPLASVEVDGNAVTREGRNWKFLLNAAGSGSELRIQEYIVQAARADLVPEVDDAIDETVTFRPTTVSLTHDDDGNLTFDGRWHYEWDAENRLIGMEEAASHSISGTGVSSGFARANRLEFAYDALGRRVRKRVLDAPRNTVGVRSGAWVLKKETVFVWQDWRLLAEYVKTPEITTLQLRRSYLWGMDLVSGVYEAGMAENATALSPAGGVGGLLWVVDYLPGQSTSNRQLAPWYDGNGNILGWVENELAQVQPLHRLEYDAFGRLLVDDPVRVALTKNHRDLGATEAWLDRPAFGFSTKYEDEETGLLYYGYRYYAPELGRWVSRDPIEEQGGINLYGMVGNDEVNFVDYLGNVQVNLKFAAFIPNTLGFAVLRSPVSNVQWMPEPDPFASTWWFSTDNRANAGQNGTSRLFSITARPISKDDIGKLERRRPVFNRARSNETHRIKIVFVGNRFPLVPQYRGWQGDFDTKISSPSVSEESVEDISPCSSKITLKAEGNYPFNGAFGLMPQMFMPSIDYKVTWTLTVNSGGIEVHVEGGHNRFPAYEAVINNRSVIYSFFPDSSGPSVGNLSAWQTFGPNGVTIIR